MLNQLELRYFKCFELLKLPLAPLTLLSGTNASGKSSILQSLVLLHQTMREYEWSTRLMLNGSVVQLGTVTDVVDQVHGRDRFDIGLLDSDTSCRWVFAGYRRDMSLEVDLVEVRGAVSNNPAVLRHLLPLNADEVSKSVIDRIRNLTYVTAERDGPREVYSLDDQYTVATVGHAGENAVSVLYRGRDDRVADGLLLPGAAPTLLHQVQARLAGFFPGCALDVQQVPNTNAVTLGIRISADTGFLRPIHCGFGITQVLPIVVAGLSAATTTDNIFLIENPEVHLHPAGQALMGQFLAEVAHVGIQVIIETHSDHVLNGIRRSVKSNKMPAEDVAIHFLQTPSLEAAQVLSPTLDSSGNIDAWPEGFFDQFDKDMNFFAGWGE